MLIYPFHSIEYTVWSSAIWTDESLVFLIGIFKIKLVFSCSHRVRMVKNKRTYLKMTDQLLKHARRMTSKWEPILLSEKPIQCLEDWTPSGKAEIWTAISRFDFMNHWCCQLFCMPQKPGPWRSPTWRSWKQPITNGREEFLECYGGTKWLTKW